jgi:uncharacterized protein (UPF0248 family)
MILCTDKGYFPLHRVLSIHADESDGASNVQSFAYVMHPKTGKALKVKVWWEDVQRVLVPIVMTTDGDM